MKTTFIYSFFLLVFVSTTPQQLLGQDSKIIEYYQSGEYDKCYKLCTNALNKNASDSDALLYSALVWTKWAQINPEDEDYKSSYSNAFDEILKKLASLRKADKSKTYINSHLDDYNIARQQLLTIADYHASIDEIEVALKMFTNTMNQLQDMGVHFYVGCSWIKYNSPELGLQYLKKGLLEYIRVFKATGQKPEAVFLEKLLETTETLAERQGYMHSLNTFQAIDILYDRAQNPNIDQSYFRCLEISLSSISVDNNQLFRVLKEHELAIKKYPKEPKINSLKNVFINRVMELFSEEYSDIENEAIEKSYRFILDSLSYQKEDLTIINKALLSTIYKLYPQNTYSGLPTKSLRVYDIFCAINNHYDKQTTAALKCVDYGFNNKPLNLNKKDAILMQAIALIIYKTKEKDLKPIASQLKELENQAVDRLSKFGVSYVEFDEVVFWLNSFPEFANLRKTIQSYLLTHSKALIASKDFSKAGLFLFKGQSFFPEIQEFKTLKRQCVEEDYKLNYVGSYFGIEELNWTGSVEGCNPGTISKIAQQKIVQRYDFIRRLSYFPDGTVLNPEENKYCQAGALCMKAQGELSHNPPPSWNCYSEEAARGAHNSLGIGRVGSCCINQMIEDGGSNNVPTGHRGNLLTPRYKAFVYGSTDVTVALSAESSTAHPDSVLKRFDAEFISWPPRGPVPSNLVFNRWSFKPYNGNFSFENAKVTMTLDGKSIELDLEHETNYKIGWVPDGIDIYASKEQVVKVIIEADVKYGYDAKPIRKSFDYEVIIFPSSIKND